MQNLIKVIMSENIVLSNFIGFGIKYCINWKKKINVNFEIKLEPELV